MGMFYLLDFDYPKSVELGLTMVHNLFFQDVNTPADMLNVFTSAMAGYDKFRNGTTV